MNAILTMVAALAIAGWAFWRLNETHARGEWWLKASVLATFCCANLVALRLIDSGWLLAALAGYLWWGIAKDRRRRRERARYERGMP